MKHINPLLLICFFTVLAGCDNSNIEYISAPTPEPVATDIELDIQASLINGSLSNNNGAFPNSIYSDGAFLLSSPDMTDEFIVSKTYSQDYSALIVNGLYDFIYQVDSPGAEVPLNEHEVILEDRLVDGDESINLNISSAVITPTFTLNGSNWVQSAYDYGEFYLQPVDTFELIPIGDTNGANDPVRVASGNYHVIYDHGQGSISPINKGARVMSNINLLTDQALEINVVSGDFRVSASLNGGNFPNSVYDQAKFFLKDQITGAETFIMRSYNSPVTVNVIDGDYDVIYKMVQSFSVPLNSAKVVASDLTLASGGSLNLNIETITVNASATLNGESFEESEYQDGYIELYDTTTDSYTILGNTNSPLNDITLIPGTYDITFSHETGNAVPQNSHGLIASAQAITTEDPLDIDIVGINISSAITFNTTSFPSSQNELAAFFLSGPQSSEDIYFASTSDQSEAVMVLAGSYDVFYRYQKGALIPQNTNYKVLSNKNLLSDSELAADIKSEYIRVAVTLNQQPFPKSFYQTGDIYASSGPNDAILVLKTYGSGQAAMVIPADYQFYYQHINGDAVPLNTWSLIGIQTVSPPPS